MRAIVLLVLVLAGCGGESPTAPPPVQAPPPTTVPPMPSVLGTWAGNWRDHVEAPGYGRRISSTIDCPTTWTITQQTGGNWSGTITVTAGHPNCPYSGPIGGTVDAGGSVTMGHGNAVNDLGYGLCTPLMGDSMHRGTMTGSGSLVIEAAYTQRCPFSFEIVDVSWNSTFTMTRR